MSCDEGQENSKQGMLVDSDSATEDTSGVDDTDRKSGSVSGAEDAGTEDECSEIAVEFSSLHLYSAAQLTAAIRCGKVTSVELLAFYLDRIDRFNADVNTVVTFDIEAARERAAAAKELGCTASGGTFGR